MTQFLKYDKIEVNILNKNTALILIFNTVYIELFIILICGNEVTMTPWWITLSATIIPAVLTCLITFYSCRKSYIEKNTEELQQIKRQLGLDDSQTLSSKFSLQYNNISKSIGKTDDDKTLTGQHKDIQTMLQKEIETAERRYSDEERRIRNFTYEQHEIAKTIDEFHLFMESWKRMASNTNAMQEKIHQLELENETLKRENQLLYAQQHNTDMHHHR